ncbi:MAG TPA: hypothetical protein VIH76_18165, partial [Candidatus Acidoferrales bacterium]
TLKFVRIRCCRGCRTLWFARVRVLPLSLLPIIAPSQFRAPEAPASGNKTRVSANEIIDPPNILQPIPQMAYKLKNK